MCHVIVPPKAQIYCRHTIICSHEGVGCSGMLRLNLMWQSNSQQTPHASADLSIDPFQASTSAANNAPPNLSASIPSSLSSESHGSLHKHQD